MHSNRIDPGESADLLGLLQGLWRGCQSWATATVLFLFPLLFWFDASFDFPLSPVLPGLGFLVLVLIVLPFGLMELLKKRVLGVPVAMAAIQVHRMRSTARLAVGIAAIWIVAWFALGA